MELKNILSLKKSSLLNKKDYADVVSKIPLNPIATPSIIENLKKLPNDEAPLDLIFAIKFEESRTNRTYSIEAYKSIVSQILNSDVFVPVCYGHQDVEKVSWEGRKIVGSVIGALLDEGAGVVYYRIIPDASEENKDIRRWIRNKQINAISIWGYSESEINSEGVEVVKDFSLLSVDLVPPLSEGQKNLALVIGEAYSKEIVDNTKNVTNNPKNSKEAFMADEKVEIKNVSNEALQGEMTSRLKDGRISLKAIADEMKGHFLTGEEFQGSEAEKAKLKNELQVLLEKAKALGFKSVDELFDFASTTLKKFEEEKATGEFNSLKAQVLQEAGLFENGKPKNKMASFIDKYAPIKQGMNREEIKAVIEKMLADKELRGLEVAGVAGEANAGEAVNLQGEMLNGRGEGVSSNNGNITVFEI